MRHGTTTNRMNKEHVQGDLFMNGMNMECMQGDLFPNGVNKERMQGDLFTNERTHKACQNTSEGATCT